MPSPSLSDNLSTILNSGYKSGEHLRPYNNFDYYSGSQITIWFGDILLDDIVSIQWQRQQNKKPIYGYASQQFDAVANGTVIVQGSFIINFRQAGYMSMIMQEIKKLYGEFSETQNWGAIRDVIGSHLAHGTFGPKTSQDIMDIGDSPDFIALAKGYEDIIWGGGVPGAAQPADIKDEAGFSDYASALPPDVKQAMDINNGFNILITYGGNQSVDPKSLNDYMQSTTKSIVGVHLLGESQTIQVGGQAVMEQYDFIARGTDENIGTSR